MPRFLSFVTWVTALVALLTSTLSCREEPGASPRPPGGSIKTLTAADTILVTDLVGSVLAETDGVGTVKGRFATYPFGATRFDSSRESQKYAGSPRDGSVGLDHMGARFYASELGVWTSPDPLATTDPERLVTSDFAAANPYAYARQSPVIAADRDGHFWHIAVGAAVGALVGGGVEAGRQYFTEGKVSDWGRVGAAAAGGGVAGAITAAVPTAGLASTLGTNAGGNVIGGVTERIIASGGQSVGTLGDVAMDAAGSVVGDGVAKGVGAAVKRVGGAVRRSPGTPSSTVRTPHGIATQEASSDAFQAIADVQGGSTVYRMGRLGVQKTSDAQFWAMSNPAATPGFAMRLGMPGDAAAEQSDWIIGGILKANAGVVTRRAPGIGANGGGTIEAVTEVGGVGQLWFHMPD